MFGLFKGGFGRSKGGRVSISFHGEAVRMTHVVMGVDGRPVMRFCEYVDEKDKGNRDKSLKAAVKRWRISGVPCVGVLSPDDYQMVQAEIPEGVTGPDVREALRWQVKDLVDWSVESALIDYFEQPARGQQRGSTVNVVLSARSKALEMVQMTDAAGLRLDVIDVPELALRNLLALTPENEQGVAFLTVGHSRSAVLVVKAGNLYLSRTFNIGDDKIEAALGRSGGGGLDDQDSEIRQMFERVVLEIQRSLDYYESYFRQRPVSALLLSPTRREVPGLVPFLKQSLGTGEIRYLDLSSLLELPEPGGAGSRFCGLATIGGALRVEPESS